MKIMRLRKATSFWKRIFFMSNVCKMRKSLMDYLTGEGIKCELKDGDIVFIYNDYHYFASFVIYDDYAECSVSCGCADENYEQLSIADKAFIADKVNIEMENHTIAYAYDSNFDIRTSYYFTSENMMIDLFSKHFEELTKTFEMTIDIVCSKLESQKKDQNRRIGFNTDASQQEKLKEDNEDISASV